MSSIFSYIIILRPLNLIFSALSVIIVAYLTDSLSSITMIMNVVIVVISFAGASNILNDIFDINIDKKNKPYRPLPSGGISLFSAFVYMLILYFLGIYIVFNLSELAIEIALMAVLPTLVLYTPIFKRIPLIGNIVVSSILGLVFLFSEAALIGTINAMWVPAYLSFGLTFIREWIKDVEDVTGDRLYGVRTIPVVIGVAKSLRLLYLIIIIFCILCWVPYYINLYGNVYAMSLLLSVEIPLILSIFFLRKNPTSSGCAMISRATKWITFGGMMTILCSTL